MILPTKHIPTAQSLLGSGAGVLGLLGQERTVTDLWERVRRTEVTTSYPRFLLSLDFLFVIGAVDMREGFIRRVDGRPRRSAEKQP